MFFHPDADLESDASSTINSLDDGNEVDDDPSPSNNF